MCRLPGSLKRVGWGLVGFVVMGNFGVMARPVTYGGPDVLTSTYDFVYAIEAGDVDGDQDNDLVISAPGFNSQFLVWWENDGSGGFATVHTIMFPIGQLSSMQLVDMDKDSDLDLVGGQGSSAAITGSRVYWFRNNGSGTFTGPMDVLPPIGVTTPCVTTGDLDGDTWLDVVIGNAQVPQSVYWCRNQQNGTFAAAVPINTTINYCVGVDTGDFDGDTDIDVVAVAFNDDIVRWFKNPGGVGVWTEQVLDTTQDGLTSCTAVDLDGDGDKDIAATATLIGRTRWYRNDGGGVFTTFTLSPATGWANDVEAADMDEDGDLDLVTSGGGPGPGGNDKLMWYENTGGAFAAGVLFSSANFLRPNELALADLDGDVDRDIALVSLSDDKVGFFENLSTPPPTATITRSLTSPSGSDVAAWKVVFSEPVGTSFTNADVQLAGPMTGGAITIVSGDDPEYSVLTLLTAGGTNGTLSMSIDNEVHALDDNALFRGAAGPDYTINNAVFTSLLGDVNKNGVVDLADVALLADYNLGLASLP